MILKSKKSAKSKPFSTLSAKFTKVGIQDMFKIWKVQVRPGVRNPVDCLLALCCLKFDGTRGTVEEFENYINTLVDQIQQDGKNFPETCVTKCVLKGLEGEYFDNIVFHNVAYYEFSLDMLFGVLKTHEAKLLRRKNRIKKEKSIGKNEDCGLKEGENLGMLEEFEAKENSFLIFDTNEIISKDTGNESDDSGYSWDTLADNLNKGILKFEQTEAGLEERQAKPKKVNILQDFESDAEKDILKSRSDFIGEDNHEMKSKVSENYVEHCLKTVINEPSHILESSKSRNSKIKEEESSLILDTLLKQCTSIFNDMRTKIMAQHQKQQNAHNEEAEKEIKLYRDRHDIDEEVDVNNDSDLINHTNSLSYNGELRQLRQYFFDIYGKTLGPIYPVGKTSKLQYERYITRRIIFEYMEKQQRSCGAVCDKCSLTQGDV